MAERTVADEVDSHDGERPPVTDFVVTTDIDVGFAPRRKPGIMTRKMGDEIVLFEPESEVLSVLDPLGGLMWGFFDGEVTIGDLADDILAVHEDALVDQVQEDLLILVKRLGNTGLLDGVVSPQRQTEVLGTYGVGEELPPFTLPDMAGEESSLTDLRGKQVLLVNWSPTCGFCLRIAPELGELAPRLADHGVELVLFTSGEVAENQPVFDDNDLHVRTFVRKDIHDEDEAHADDALEDDEWEEPFRDPFAAMGTPVAYMLDADGKVARPIAVGATDVPALARSLSGEAEVELEEDELPADGRYLNLSEGETCGPGGGSGKAPRVWAATDAYQIGDYRIGIRTDSDRTRELVGEFLASVRMPEGSRAPGDYAIVLGDGGTTKTGLNLVLQGNSTVVRSRSPRRAMLGLAAYLASHESTIRPGRVRVSAMAVVTNGEAVILPEEVNDWLDELQPRLARDGSAPVDRPFVTVDLETREVVVDDPGVAIALDLSVLDEVPEPPPRRSERPMVEPGRYPLRRWLIWQSNEEPPRTPGQLVARALAACIETKDAFDETLDAMEAFRDDGVLFPFDFMFIDELHLRLPLAAAGRPHDHLSPPERAPKESATA